jgi:phosphoglycerate kinase
MFKTLKDLDFKGKKVIVRIGLDVPVDGNGNVLDDQRIKISVPTIKYLLDHSAEQIILMGHMGRPKNKEERLSTRKVAKVLSKLLGEKVIKIDDWGENGIPNSKIVVLENVRFNKLEKDKSVVNRDKFGKQLASLADIYVEDAFSNCHRDQASMTSVSKFIPGCVGMSVEKEVSLIKKSLDNPKKPTVVVMGGLKADKLNAIVNLLGKVDKILIAGALAFTLLKAEGYEMGDSKIDAEGLKSLSSLVKKINNNPKIKLPVDAVIADKFDANANSKIVSIDQVSKGWMALDLGPETIAEYKKIISSAKTILWFGPIGVFEFDKFAKGTKEIGKAIAENKGVSIIGGGDSAKSVESLGLEDKMTLVSTGGGASLTLIEGKELVALKVLS